MRNFRNSFGNLVAVRFFDSGNFRGNLAVCGGKYGAAADEISGLYRKFPHFFPKVSSTLYPGQQRDAWLVRYTVDGAEEHFEVEELRSGSNGPPPVGGDGKPVLIVRKLPERSRICQGLAPIFDYLEARITGTTVGESECQAGFPPFPWWCSSNGERSELRKMRNYNYFPETFPEIKQSIARIRFRKFGTPAAEFSA